MAMPQGGGALPDDRPGPSPTDQEAEAPRTGFRYILANRNFRLIWFAQVAAQLADKFLMFSLIILAYRLSHGSTPVAVTLLAYTVPAVAIAPLAGHLPGRHRRNAIMGGTHFRPARPHATSPYPCAPPPAPRRGPPR